MFNKEFTKIQLTEASLESFYKICKDPWFGSHADFNEAYIRRYFMPRIFLPRNKEIAEKFVSNKILFKDAAKRDLLKECDLTDFIIEHKNELEKYPSLFSVTSGYKLSDEAAWILMENPQHEDILHSAIVNVHSVWFRTFEHEDTTSFAFKKRIERAVRWRNYHLRDLTPENLANKNVFSVRIFDFSQRILNFHLGTAFLSRVDSIFGGYIFQIMSQDYPTVDKRTLFWMLSNLESSELYMCAVIAPVLLYSDDVPWYLNKHVEEAKELIREIYGDELKCRIWKELLGSKNFKKLINDYPDLLEAPFVTSNTMWEDDSTDIISDLISVYRSTNNRVLNTSNVKVLKKIIKKQLEKTFNIQIESSPIEQLISIYETSKEKVSDV